MFILFRLLLLLPLAVSWPTYIKCEDDDVATRLKLGSRIMMKRVEEASSSVTMQALRNGKAVSSYIPGEVLQVHVMGFTHGWSAVLRANDESNTTIHTESSGGLFEAKCDNQVYVPTYTTLPGTEATLPFRPGCNSKAPLVLTFITTGGYRAPLFLSKLSLTREGTQDPSCTGAPIRKHFLRS